MEDEALVAFFIEDCLTKLGHEVLGRASRVGKALKLAEAENIDLALLDMNVAGEEVYPVAARLKERGIPFIFLSGYGAERLCGEWAGHRLLEKPLAPARLACFIAAAVTTD